MKIRRFLFLCLFLLGIASFVLTSCEFPGMPTESDKFGTVMVENEGDFVGGTVTLSAIGEVKVGTSVTIIVTPYEGYALDEIIINGKTSLIDRFEVIEGENIVSAKFKEVQYGDVSLTVGDGGSASLSKEGKVAVGENVSITVEPDEGYGLEEITLNGEKIEGLSFVTVEGNNEVVVSFKELVEPEKVLLINSTNFNSLEFMAYTNVVPNQSYPNEFTVNKLTGSIFSKAFEKVTKLVIVVYNNKGALTITDSKGNTLTPESSKTNGNYNNALEYVYLFNEDSSFKIENLSTTNVYFFELNVYYKGELDGSVPFIEIDGRIDINTDSYDKDTRIICDNITADEKLVFGTSSQISASNLTHVVSVEVAGANGELSVYSIDGNDLVKVEGEYLENLGKYRYTFSDYNGTFIIKNESGQEISVDQIVVVYDHRTGIINDVSIERAVAIAKTLSSGQTTEDVYRITGVVTANNGTQVTVYEGDFYIIAFSSSAVDNMIVGYTVTLVGQLQNYYYKYEFVNYYVESFVEATYNVNLIPSENGTFEVNKQENFQYGEEIIITATPNDEYYAEYASIDGRRYKFVNNVVKAIIIGNSNISVHFKKIGEEDQPLGEDIFTIHSLEMSGTYGDANLVQYGNFDILFDAGTADDGYKLSLLLETYVSDGILDLIIISHPDSDHYDGLLHGALNGVDEVKRLITNNGHAENEKIKTAVLAKSPNALLDTAANLTSIDNKMYTIEVDEEFHVNIMYSSGYEGTGKNNASIPTIVTYKNTKLFMGGDMEESACTSFLNMYPDLFSEDDYVIFKGLHHGSNGSNKTNFLAYLKPDFAFVSAPLKTNSSTAPNFNTHPYLDAMIRIGAYTTETYWAGINGNLTIECDGYRAIAYGETRTRDYKYLDKETGTYVTVDRASEVNTPFFNSYWYRQAIENNGAPDYAGILNN